MDNLYAVIFAGGVGTRLWPVSRQNSPKQLKPFLDSNDTLVQKTWERVRKILPPENIYISTVKGYENFLIEQLPEFLPNHLIVEPELRNTCPAIGLATAVVAKEHPGAFMMNVWADHYYAQEDKWVEVIQKSFNYLKQHPELVVSVGLPIIYPYTGYGYLEVQSEPIIENVFAVKRFVEKPSLEQAQEFMQAGNYYWNPALWLWQGEKMLSIYRQLVPDIYQGLQTIQAAWGTPDELTVLQNTYPTFTKVAVDYAIFEKGPQMVLIPADLGWKDVGSWQSVHEVLNGKQKTGVAVKGKALVVNCQDVLVFNEDTDKLVTVVGLEDVAVVNTPDALLVVRKSRDQEVKGLVERLEKEEMTEYL
ncbi:MAG: sugar phosphate nucleotidyltransferase [Patescibacteria group bacterium]|jgi:mannose-1-phosphate guanylyltransferase